VGSGQHVSNASGYKVISDFRTNDIALGGQGAPLVPIGDRIFFDKYDFCLNLGGISNISFEIKGKRIAYDIGLANMILNYITRKIDLEYDNDGKIARKGKIIPKMLKGLSDLKYYTLPHHKSIGYEWFLEEVVPIVENNKAPIEDQLHTCVHHVCDKITQQIQLNSNNDKKSLLVTGGGALNTFLMETLKEKLGDKTTVIIPNKIIIEFKEALVFALMGALRIEQLTNVLSSVTGARKDSSSGVVYLPN